MMHPMCPIYPERTDVMRVNLRSVAAVIFVTGLLSAVGAAPASARSDNTCGESDGYVPATECTVDIEEVVAECTAANQPVLTYAVSTNTGAQSVHITLEDSDGTVVTLAEQPLTGSPVWPASVDATSTTVTFTTSSKPELTASTTVETPMCTTAVLSDTPEDLAATGAEVLPYAAAAAGLVVVGTTAFLVARRRRAQA